jgi:tellurite resistance protein
MSEAVLSPVAVKTRLEYLPVGLFGSAMGLTGLSVAWRLAHNDFGAPSWVALAIGYIAIAAFIVLLGGYGVKLVTAFDAVRSEFRHPIAGNLFGTIFISALLLPIVLAPLSLPVARVLWVAGAVGMLLFAWIIMNRWMSDRQQVAHATPAWIIPLVGMLDIPLALPELGLPPMHGLMVFSLAVGLFFAVPIFTLILSRLFFEPPMPDALKPTLMILLAPFAVGYSTYTTTTGQTDIFAASLYMLTLFLLAVLVGLLRDLLKCCPFRISWWAVSFPLAAASIATLRFAETAPDALVNAIALIVLALATVVIAGLFLRTLIGLAKGELRTLSGT